MGEKENFYVYILASKRYGTFYIGVTSNLVQRIWQHRNDEIEGFTSKYSVKQLVWYERHENSEHAIKRERNMKEWQRQWKIELIEEANPYWHDLYHDMAKRANV